MLWASLLPTLLLDEIPEPTGEIVTDVARWDLYRIPVEVQGIELTVEVVVGEGDGESYLVLFQAAPDDFDGLRDAVLVPAVEAFRPLEAEPPSEDGTAEEIDEDNPRLPG